MRVSSSVDPSATSKDGPNIVGIDKKFTPQKRRSMFSSSGVGRYERIRRREWPTLQSHSWNMRSLTVKRMALTLLKWVGCLAVGIHPLDSAPPLAILHYLQQLPACVSRSRAPSCCPLGEEPWIADPMKTKDDAGIRVPHL